MIWVTWSTQTEQNASLVPFLTVWYVKHRPNASYAPEVTSGTTSVIQITHPAINVESAALLVALITVKLAITDTFFLMIHVSSVKHSAYSVMGPKLAFLARLATLLLKIVRNAWNVPRIVSSAPRKIPVFNALSDTEIKTKPASSVPYKIVDIAKRTQILQKLVYSAFKNIHWKTIPAFLAFKDALHVPTRASVFTALQVTTLSQKLPCVKSAKKTVNSANLTLYGT